MKIRSILLVTAALLFSTFISQLSKAFAQGILTPPGAPAPTMKTLTQIEPRTPISSLPYVITNAGSYYLTGNVVGVSNSFGITISSGNVTLDLSGFAMLGVPGSYDGIAVLGNYTNITVRNGTVSGWGGNAGVNALNYGSPRNLVFEKLVLSGNSAGLNIYGPSVVRDCLSESNSTSGMNCEYGLVTHCVINDNGSTGLSISYGQARDCHVQANGLDGIAATDSTVQDCQALSNGRYGILCSASVARDCQVRDSGSIGIFADPGDVLNCIVDNSARTGIEVLAPGCQLIGNICRGNNTLSNSIDAGILISANNNQVEGNHLASNLVSGIRVFSGTNNVIVKNSVFGDGTNDFVIAANNDLGPVGSAATNSSPWGNISH